MSVAPFDRVDPLVTRCRAALRSARASIGRDAMIDYGTLGRAQAFVHGVEQFSAQIRPDDPERPAPADDMGRLRLSILAQLLHALDHLADLLEADPIDGVVLNKLCRDYAALIEGPDWEPDAATAAGDGA